MRATLTTLTAVGMTVGTLAFAPTSAASGPSLDDAPHLVEDVHGDANGLNTQGNHGLVSIITGDDGDVVPDTSTAPASVDEADILGARMTATYDEVLGEDGLVDRIYTGIEFRTALAAAPNPDSPPLLYRFNVTAGSCSFFVQYEDGLNQTAEASVRYGSGCVAEDGTVPDLSSITAPWITHGFDDEHGELVVHVDHAAANDVLRPLLDRGKRVQLDEIEVRGITPGTISPNNVLLPLYDTVLGDGTTRTRYVVGSDIPEDERPGDANGPLVLGLHGPSSGAAPLPTTSFASGAELYWRYRTETLGLPVLGHNTVEVTYLDDGYVPDTAVEACAELAEDSLVVLGTFGVDQIQACAQLAGSRSVPYMSPGTTTAGLVDEAWYFAQSMSHADQAVLLAEYVAADPDADPLLGPDAVIGTIALDVANLDDLLDGWDAGMAANGLTEVARHRYARGAIGWHSTVARQMLEAGVEVIHFAGDPIELLQFAQTARSTYAYEPRLIGVGMLWGRNAVLNGGCNNAPLDGSVVVSPITGLDRAPLAFDQAAADFDAEFDDTTLLLWSQAEQLAGLFDAYEQAHGQDVTREQLRAFAETTTVETAGLGTVTWTPTSHFGSSTAHVLRADCASRQFTTLHSHASGF